MRVSQNMLYDNFVTYLNNSTTRLQELSLQASTQKKVNRPSDSPVGMARILNYRDSIQANQQYQANINTATGWLGLADNTLMQVQDIMARINELAVQGANAPMTAENRQSIALEVRQQFDQLISLANTTYEGKSIFAGHRTGEPAYTKGLAVSSNQTRQVSGNREVDLFASHVQEITGSSQSSIQVEFLGVAGDADADSAVIGGGDEIRYRYSTDSGQSFSTVTLASEETELELGDVTVKLRKGLEVSFPDPDLETDGTQLLVQPAAIYQGDDRNKPGAEVNHIFDIRVESLQGSFDSEVRVKVIGVNGDGVEYQYSLDQGASWSDSLYADEDSGEAILHLPGGEVRIRDTGSDGLDNLEFTLGGTQVQQLNSDLHAVAAGDFQKNVLVRIDDDVDLSVDDEISYSYSTDQGRNWVSGNTAPNSTEQDEYAQLVVPGGTLKLTYADEESLQEGDQFLIQPRGADISTEISQDVNMAMNNVGPDIFGGHYQNQSGMETAFEEDEQKNLFLGVGKLIAALETNDQEGVQESLGYLDKAMVQVGNMQADIGARENRLQVTQTMLEGLELNDKERKGRIEDVDFAELMSQLTQQQTVYQAILKSSSMIMKMSLVNYV